MQGNLTFATGCKNRGEESSMLDAVSMDRLTNYSGLLLKLLDAKPVLVEEFQKDIGECPGKTIRVLRELTEDESFLLFMDYSVFRAIQESMRKLVDAGHERFAGAPGGVWLQWLNSHGLVGVKIMLGSIHAEYSQIEPGLDEGKYVIGFEIVDGAICFILSEPEKGSSPKDIVTTLVGQALQRFLHDQENNAQQEIGLDVDLRTWNPGSAKVH